MIFTIISIGNCNAKKQKNPHKVDKMNQFTDNSFEFDDEIDVDRTKFTRLTNEMLWLSIQLKNALIIDQFDRQKAYYSNYFRIQLEPNESTHW